IQSPDRAKSWVKTDRLTLWEKKIFSAYLNIRDNKISETLDELQKIPKTELRHVCGQKHLLMGEIYLSLGHHLESEKYLRLAISGFKTENDLFSLSMDQFGYINLLA